MSSLDTSPVFRAESYLLARIPLLPITAMIEWAEAAISDHGDDWLREMLARPDVQAAIEIASPSLAAAIDESSKLDRALPARVRRSFIRYLLRMTSRPTPFGLFAGTAVGSTGNLSRLTIRESPDHRVFARLDGEALTRARDALEQDPAAAAAALLFVNSTAYVCGRELRFVETASENGGSTYLRSTAVLDRPLQLVLDAVRPGQARTRDDVVRTLVEAGFDHGDARLYVDDIVRSQIICSELSYLHVADSPLHEFLQVANRIASEAPVTRCLAAIQEHLHCASNKPLPDAIPELRAVTSLARASGLTTDAHDACDVQLRLDVDICLGVDIVRKAELAADILARTNLGAPDSPHSELGRELDSFCQAFTDRFGDASVPLMVALDPDIGAGFRGGGSPQTPSAPESQAITQRDRILMAKVAAAIAAGEQRITLDKSDIDSLSTSRGQRLPSSALMSVRLARSGDGQHQLYAAKLGGPDAACALGRFASGDATLTSLLRHTLAHEADPTVHYLDAEIVHLVGGRLANIIARPQLRDYEIACMGFGQAAADKTIALDDVLVSVQGRRVVLYSKRHHAAIRPHLSCAHKAHHSDLPAVYRFLFAVGLQHLDTVLLWQWGALEALPFLPRVEFGDIVLALARWRLTAADLESGPSPDVHAYNTIRALSARFALPRFVAVMTGGDELVVDLENPDAADTTLSLLRETPNTTLTEAFPAPELAAVHGPAGSFMHEFLLPLRRTTPAQNTRPLRFHADFEEQRTVFVGGDWLYLRIGAGPRIADTILLEVLSPLLRDLTTRGVIDQWFFIRYADPRPHLRVRLNGNPEALRELALAALLPPLTNALTMGIVAELQLDTYRPELRRYGGVAAMQHAERLFCLDSVATVKALQLALSEDRLHDPDHRIVIGCLGASRLLESLVPDTDTRLALLERLAANAFDADASTAPLKRTRRRELAAALRRQQQALMNALFAEESEYEGYRIVFDHFRRSAKPSVAGLSQLAESDSLTTTYGDIVQSLLHMHVNRMFAEEPRRHESIVYDFLHRLYRGQAARRGALPITRARTNSPAPSGEAHAVASDEVAL